MNFQQMRNEAAQPEKPGSSSTGLTLESLVAEQKTTIGKQSAKIRMLAHENSLLQSANQQMQSAMTAAKKQIGELTDRAKGSSEAEEKYRSLKQRTDAKISELLEDLRRKDGQYKKGLEEARSKENNGWCYVHQAEEKADTSERLQGRMRKRYQSLFIGYTILTATIAVLGAWNKTAFFRECGQWFVGRAGNMVSFVIFLGSAFMALAAFIGERFPGMPSIWRIVIAAGIYAGAAVGLFFLIRILVRKAAKVFREIRDERRDDLFIQSLTAAVVIGLFYTFMFSMNR